jgi:hypothetical protein
MHGSVAVVGAWNAGGAGAAYVLEFGGSEWAVAFRLNDSLGPSDLEPGDEFGLGVFVRGDLIIAGANKDDVAGVADAGSAYVFQRAGGTWTKAAHLTPSHPEPSLELGNNAVWISEELAVAGAARSTFIFARGPAG